jgi:hypothetical protein
MMHSERMSELEKPVNHTRRKSASADASFRAEVARVKGMTIEDRVKASLSMRERFAWLQPVSRDK